MILQTLYRLAQREGLMRDPDYEWRPVAWLVRVDEGGKLVGIEGTHHLPEETGRKRKAKPIPKEFRIPRQPVGRSGTKAPSAFFVDNAKYVFGLSTKDKEIPRKEGTEKSGWFRKLIADCAQATGDEGARAVLSFLEDVSAGRKNLPLPTDCRSNDLFAFVYGPDYDRLVHERPAVEAYWKARRSQGDEPLRADRRCLVTGTPIGESGLFPLVEDVPGAKPARIGLVSFNKAAFESYGWAGNDNAPISREAAELCSTALKRLLDPTPRSPRGDPLPGRNFQVSKNTVVCFWASDKSADPFLDQLPFLMLGHDPGKVGDVYRSLWKGRRVQMDDLGRFYALTISGTQGRAIVRDWFESSVAEVAENLARHFEDLEIVRNTPRARDRELPPHVPLRVLLDSLAPPGATESVPPQLAADFVHAALRYTRYPFSILQRALERARAEIGRQYEQGLEGWRAKERADARAALIRAVLRRNTPFKEIRAMMDPTNSNAGYLLGRLMATIERLQQAALGDVNASVVDRYFAAASATPRAVFTRILKNTRHHASKAKDDPQTSGTARWLEGLIDEIASRFDPKQNGFPAYLDLAQQGLFVLGYHQQRHWLWMSREERERSSEPAAVTQAHP